MNKVGAIYITLTSPITHGISKLIPSEIERRMNDKLKWLYLYQLVIEISRYYGSFRKTKRFKHKRVKTNEVKTVVDILITIPICSRLPQLKEL